MSKYSVESSDHKMGLSNGSRYRWEIDIPDETILVLKENPLVLMKLKQDVLSQIENELDSFIEDRISKCTEPN